MILWRVRSILTTSPPTCTQSSCRKMSSRVQVNESNQLVTIAPSSGSPATAAVIFLHGLGDTAFGWSDTMEQIASTLPNVKFILPTASMKPVSLNMGMAMPSWYDIKTLDDRKDQTCDGIEDSRTLVNALIQEQVRAGVFCFILNLNILNRIFKFQNLNMNPESMMLCIRNFVFWIIGIHSSEDRNDSNTSEYFENVSRIESELQNLTIWIIECLIFNLLLLGPISRSRRAFPPLALSWAALVKEVRYRSTRGFKMHLPSRV